MTSARATTPASLRLRPLTLDDVPALDVLERQLFGAAAWSADSLAQEIVGPDRWYVGAQVDDELVGYAGLWFDGVDAQVMTVGTALGHQGAGVGRALLEALLARAREVGAESVLLEVRVDNEPALRLYESAGFVTLGRRRGYYQPENKDAWTMRLDLAAHDGTGE